MAKAKPIHLIGPHEVPENVSDELEKVYGPKPSLEDVLHWLLVQASKKLAYDKKIEEVFGELPDGDIAIPDYEERN